MESGESRLADRFSLFEEGGSQREQWTFAMLDIVQVRDIRLSSWWHIFLSILVWMGISYVAVTITAALVALVMLRRHPYVVFFVLPMLAMVVIFPITVGASTSAVLAFTLVSANKTLSPFYCLILGVIQTFVALIFSFSRILGTL